MESKLRTGPTCHRSKKSSELLQKRGQISHGPIVLIEMPVIPQRKDFTLFAFRLPPAATPSASALRRGQNHIHTFVLQRDAHANGMPVFAPFLNLVVNPAFAGFTQFLLAAANLDFMHKTMGILANSTDCWAVRRRLQS